MRVVRDGQTAPAHPAVLDAVGLLAGIVLVLVAADCFSATTSLRIGPLDLIGIRPLKSGVSRKGRSPTVLVRPEQSGLEGLPRRPDGNPRIPAGTWHDVPVDAYRDLAGASAYPSPAAPYPEVDYPIEIRHGHSSRTILVSQLDTVEHEWVGEFLVIEKSLVGDFCTEDLLDLHSSECRYSDRGVFAGDYAVLLLPDYRCHCDRRDMAARAREHQGTTARLTTMRLAKPLRAMLRVPLGLWKRSHQPFLFGVSVESSSDSGRSPRSCAPVVYVHRGSLGEWLPLNWLHTVDHEWVGDFLIVEGALVGDMRCLYPKCRADFHKVHDKDCFWRLPDDQRGVRVTLPKCECDRTVMAHRIRGMAKPVEAAPSILPNTHRWQFVLTSRGAVLVPR